MLNPPFRIEPCRRAMQAQKPCLKGYANVTWPDLWRSVAFERTNGQVANPKVVGAGENLGRGEIMAGITEKRKIHKMVLHLRIRTKATHPNALLSFLKRAVHFYEAPGGIRIRLLRNTRDPQKYIEIVEYDSRKTYEEDQHRVEHDPQMKKLLQEWRSLLTSDIKTEVYEDVTEQI
jgi:hypothetical protein